MRPRRTVTAGLALALAATGLGSVAIDTAAGATTANRSDGDSDRAATRNIDLRRWSTDAAWRNGTRAGVGVRNGAIRIDHRIGIRTYADPFGGDGPRRYGFAHWTSPWVQPGFGLTELIPSWNANTARGSWIEIAVRGRGGGAVGSWDVMGRWANGDRGFHRTSPSRQPDDRSSVNVDTLVLDRGHRYSAWQLRVTLLRRIGTTGSPAVQSAGAVASRVPRGGSVQASATTMRRTVELDIPRWSQMVHRGDYPQYDGGGRAWCSPTSVAMVLGYWRRLPTPKQYAWVKKPHPARWVDHGARYSYDYRYEGAGNWPFNTAYAGTLGLDAYVTRLPSLRAAERFIRRGVPLVASIAFGAGELDGAPLGSTPGHLLVIRGFTRDGRVIANDPAADYARGVRRVYQRRQFENAWLPTTGGTVYVLQRPGAS
ncbi:MAG: C39 family peptidase [Nocardioidaceae bacterium]